MWKAAIALENEETAKLMLNKAVECVPKSVDLWLALAKLEDYEAAKKVINRAREAIPDNYNIWVHASKLEEANDGTLDKINLIMDRAFRVLIKRNMNLTREAWIQEAQNCEIAGSPITAIAIINVSIILLIL